MIQFEHSGPEWPAISSARSVFLAVFLAVGAVLLFPFTLLALFLRSLEYLAGPRPTSR